MAQGKITPNIGEIGTESIRLGGMKIDDLPIGEAANAKLQLPMAEETERQNLIEGIKARYPKQSVAYLEARIREARGSIAKFREQRARIGSEREKYSILLHDAEKRDRDIEEAKAQLGGDDLKAEIRKLRDKYGPWQTEGLRNQIEQFAESSSRFEDAIEAEQKSIDEMTELLGQCRARDKELARLGR